jgi:Zn-dependent protease with chaperone function
LSLVSLYLRLWFSAKPFESPELDALADRMLATTRMSGNPRDRWYEGRGSVGYTFRNRVVFGKKLSGMLSGGQRLAVAAHELVHVREDDSRHANTHIVYPAAIVGFAVFLTSLILWRIFPASALFFVVSWTGSLSLLFLGSAGWRRRVELRCDVVACSYVDGNDLTEVLRIQDSLIPPKMRKTLAYRLASRMYPSNADREHAIRNAMQVEA